MLTLDRMDAFGTDRERALARIREMRAVAIARQIDAALDGAAASMGGMTVDEFLELARLAERALSATAPSPSQPPLAHAVPTPPPAPPGRLPLGQVVTYKGGVYSVAAAVRARHPGTGAWIDSYLYQSMQDGGLYVREMNDFEEKFTPLNLSVGEQAGRGET